MSKGIVFAGCSFTWGQGLNYYSDLPTINKNILPYNFHPQYYTHAQIEFIKKNRFARKIADHFNTFELTQPFNGGSIDSIIDWWRECFYQQSPHTKFSDEKQNTIDPKKYDPHCFHVWKTSHHHRNLIPSYDFSEVSDIIFQVTWWNRSWTNLRTWPQIQYPWSGPHNTYVSFTNDPKYEKILNNFLIEKNITIDDFIKISMEYELVKIKNFLNVFENNGVRSHILSWPNHYDGNFLEQMLNDQWFTDRIIRLRYKNKNYYSLQDMMDDFEELTIATDYDNIIDPPPDYHPSLTLHNVITKAIIKKLESNL